MRNEGGKSQQYLDLANQKSQRASLYFSQVVVLDLHES